MVTNKELARKAKILRVIGHPIRLEILHLLATAKSETQYKIKDLKNHVSHAPDTVKEYLRLMRDLKILSCRREVYGHYYKIADPMVREIMDVIRKNG